MSNEPTPRTDRPGRLATGLRWLQDHLYLLEGMSVVALSVTEHRVTIQVGSRAEARTMRDRVGFPMTETTATRDQFVHLSYRAEDSIGDGLALEVVGLDPIPQKDADQ